MVKHSAELERSRPREQELEFPKSMLTVTAVPRGTKQPWQTAAVDDASFEALGPLCHVVTGNQSIVNVCAAAARSTAR